MKEIINEFGKKVGEVTEQIGKKTEEIVEIQRLKNQVRTLKRNNEKDYSNMGKLIFVKYKNGESLEVGLTPFCEAIKERQEEVASLEKQIAELRGKEVCPQCGSSVEMEATFCSRCGAKLEREFDSDEDGMEFEEDDLKSYEEPAMEVVQGEVI